MSKIRVFAIPPFKVAKIGANGRPMPAGNAVGWGTGEDGKLFPLPDGAVVEDHSHYRRAASEKRSECRIEEVTT